MADYDPYSALTLDEPTAAEMARARAAALRGQNFAGLVGSLAHDPYAARSGAAMMDQAQQGLTQLGQLPGARLKQALGQQELQQAGPQAALGGETPSIYKLLTGRKEAEAMAQYRQAMLTQNWTPFTNSDTGETFLINHRTGQIRPMGAGAGPMPAPPPGATAPSPTAGAGDVPTAAGAMSAPSGSAAPQLPQGRPMGKLGQKWLTDLKTDLDPNASRAGVMKGNQERLNSAQRLLTLATDPLTGGPADLTPQQMSEVSSSFASLLGGGSSGETTRREFTPYTKGRTMAELMQWVTDNPHGAGQQAFVKQLMESANREKNVAADQLRQAQAQRLSAHVPLFQRYPRESMDVLQSYGFDPSEVDLATGRYTPKAKSAGPPQGGHAPGNAGAAVARARRTVNGETREWDGRAWVPVNG